MTPAKHHTFSPTELTSTVKEAVNSYETWLLDHHSFATSSVVRIAFSKPGFNFTCFTPVLHVYTIYYIRMILVRVSIIRLEPTLHMCFLFMFTQCSATLMHLLALMEASDAPRFKDMLSKRSETLRQLLWQQADSVVLQMEDSSSATDISSIKADCNLALHAASPFFAAASSTTTNITSAQNMQQASEVSSIPPSAVGQVGAVQVMPGAGMAEVICALRSMHVRLPSDPFCLRAAGMAISSSPSPSMGSSPPYSPRLLSKLMSLGEDRSFDSGRQGSAFPLHPTLTASSPFGSFPDAPGVAVPGSVQAYGVVASMTVLSVVEAAVARGLSEGGGCRMSLSLGEESCGVAAALGGLARVLEPLKEKHAALLESVKVLAGNLQLLRRLAGLDS